MNTECEVRPTLCFTEPFINSRMERLDGKCEKVLLLSTSLDPAATASATSDTWWGYISHDTSRWPATVISVRIHSRRITLGSDGGQRCTQTLHHRTGSTIGDPNRSLMESGGQTKTIMQVARERAEILPSPEALERFGTHNMLALIHDAICHLVTPVNRLPKVLPALEQIANSLAEQQTLLREILNIKKDAALVHFVADKLEGAPSLSHSVLNRDLRFVSVNKSYAHLFEFSPTQFKNMSLIELVHTKDIPRFNKIIKVLLKGTVGTCELVGWRATGSGRFVLTKDTLWGIGSDRVRGPEYISTVSEKITDQDEAAMLVEGARLHNRHRSRQ